MELSSKDIEMVELFMGAYVPDEVTLVDGCKSYASTLATHQSYNANMIGATIGTWARKVYTQRCYDWLVLLKKSGVKMTKITSDLEL